jgi:DNA repair exonuclease SbcCD nuclease subunit
MIAELLRTVKKQKCAFLVICGDFFDRPSPSHEERAIVADLFKKSSVPIFAITGNHDKWGAKADQTALNWLVKLAPKFGHRVWSSPKTEKVDGVWWLALPYGGWNQAETNLLINWLLEHVPSKTSAPIIGLAHEFFDGAIDDSGFIGKGRKHPALPSVGHKVTYWALGDVHKLQKQASYAWYSGSPYQIDFGEVLPKGVLIVDTEKKTPEFIEFTAPRPLIELREVPEIWPENAYIKLVVSPDQVPYPVPKCVVQLGSPTLSSTAFEKRIRREEEEEDLVHGKISSNYLLEGMEEFLRDKKAISPKGIKRAMEFAQTLIQKQKAS